MRLSLAITSALLIMTATNSVHAHYAGPTTQPTLKTVASVLKDGVDDQRVLLTGRLVKQISADKYLFADATGEIRVEIDDELFIGKRVDDKVRVELIGDVEKDFMESPEVDVDLLSLVSDKK